MRTLIALLAVGAALTSPSVAFPDVAVPILLAEADHPPAGDDAKAGKDGAHPKGEDGDHPKGEGDGKHDEHAKDGPSLTPQSDLALWSLVTFVVLLAVLWKFAWGPITSGLDTRESRIRDDIAKAEADRTRAAQLLTEHEQRLKAVEDEIREMRTEARAAADKMKADAVAAGKEEAAALVEKAKGEIEQDRRNAEEQLKRELADMVVNAAEQVITRKMNDGDEQRLADEALQQFAGSV